MAMQQPALIAGLYRDEPAAGGAYGQRLQDLWRDNLGSGYNFTLLNVTRDLGNADPGTLTLAAYEALPHGAFTRRAHAAFNNGEWHSIGGVLANLPCPGLALDVTTHIVEEAAQWAGYLGMHSLTFNLGALLGKADADHAAEVYAGLFKHLLQDTIYEGFHLWTRVPWTDAGWRLWHLFRSRIGETAKNRLHVVVALEGLEARQPHSGHLARWYGESLQAVALPTSVFTRGGNGPLLPPHVEAACRGFLAYPHIKWLIEGPCLHGGTHAGYRDCLEILMRRHPLTPLELFLLPSTDQLQRPMQPLQDQLHSSSYALFEQDPVKYVQYEQAIRQALLDRHRDSATVTLMVLGAGRGPLVDAALRAAKGLSCRLKLFAIEKNPTALVTLKHRAGDDWAGHDVTVVAADMRAWEGEQRADILVSELLGSWGDNELSPECLDGAIHLLKDDGVCIPCAYTSYLAPIASAKLYSAVAAQAPWQFPGIDPRRFLESTYVVKMGAVFPLAPEQPCFTFRHPDAGNESNERHAVCTFTLPAALSQCLVHGFRGTFDCTLYGDTHICIADSNHSTGMFCWFPLYIPLEQPLTVPGGGSITVHVWRRVSATRVWYEWQVEGLTPVHNPDGRSSWLGLG